MALIDLATGVRRSPRVWLPGRARSADPLRRRRGSSPRFLQAVGEAAPLADVVLVHAGAAELGRLFAGRTVRPLLLAAIIRRASPRPTRRLKLLAQRAGLMVADLLLAAAPEQSPRAERIAAKLAHDCADPFFGAPCATGPASIRRRPDEQRAGVRWLAWLRRAAGTSQHRT